MLAPSPPPRARPPLPLPEPHEQEALDRADALLALPLAGGDAARSILSAVSDALLPFFSTREARALRGVCREFRAAVAAFPWHDAATRIRGSLAAWRASFPLARAANAAQRALDDDADWQCLAGEGRMRELVVACCGGVTDARLARFRLLERLDARECTEFSRRGLAALKELDRADLRGCVQLEEEEEGGEEGAAAMWQDGRFELGAVDSCCYCGALCLFNSAECAREHTYFEGVSCTARRVGGDEGEAAVCCEDCIARRGCFACARLECGQCSAEQDEAVDGYEDYTTVGRGIAPCAACRRSVCGARQDNSCAGECGECGRLLCRACADFRWLACAPCDAYMVDEFEHTEEERDYNCAVCGDCRRRTPGIDCGAGLEAACRTRARREDAMVFARHQLEVQRKAAKGLAQRDPPVPWGAGLSAARR